MVEALVPEGMKREEKISKYQTTGPVSLHSVTPDSFYMKPMSSLR